MSILRYKTASLTTYDLVKTLAIVLMILDHIGYFFYPDNHWFRVVGRACVPMWLFLVGYAQTRDVSRRLWLWGGAVVVANFVFGGPLFPLNIIFSILFIRLMLDKIAGVAFRNWEFLTYTVIALCVLYIPTMILFEYGTAGLMLAMCGYAIRNMTMLPISIVTQRVFIIFAVGFYALASDLLFRKFTVMESQAMYFLVGLSALMMYFFKPLELIWATRKLPGIIVGMLQFTGRYTLEIYVIHLIAFKAVAAYYGLAGHGFFDWAWVR